MTLISFGFFLLLFVFIGFLSSFKKKSSSADYLLASHSSKPWLVGFAAVATNCSGYMFIGLIGFTYKYGLASMWLMIGGMTGDFVASLFCHKKLREASGKHHALSFAGTIANWYGQNHTKVQFFGGIATFVFLTAYASAQLTAGGKALYVLFDWNYNYGVLIGACIILTYCFLGGVRASIWTNTAQAFVMIFSMGLLFFSAINKIGGFEQFYTIMQTIHVNYASIWPYDINYGTIGIILFLLGWFFGGITVIGQPHIMLAFMTMEKPKDIKQVRVFYYSWYILFSTLTIGVGLVSRILLPELQNFDSEFAMPKLAQTLMPEVVLGFILAGLFSATMSTADSQILCCASALTNDITKRRSYIATKTATVFSTIIAVLIAIYGSTSVFILALISWSALAGVFAPLFVLYVFNYKTTQKQAIFIMFVGLFSALLWFAAGLSGLIYESMIGFLAGLLAYPISKKLFTI